MYQELIFIGIKRGTSQKSNKPYDFLSVSDGIQVFTLDYDKALLPELEKYQEGDKIGVIVHVKNGYSGLRGTVVSVADAE